MLQECKFSYFKRSIFSYKIALNSDIAEFGGHSRLDANQEFHTYPEGYAGRANHIAVYIPSRVAIVLEKVR